MQTLKPGRCRGVTERVSPYLSAVSVPPRRVGSWRGCWINVRTSPRTVKAAGDESMKLMDLYNGRYGGWNVKHFYAWYQRDHDVQCSYSWVKNILQRQKDNAVNF